MPLISVQFCGTSRNFFSQLMEQSFWTTGTKALNKITACHLVPAQARNTNMEFRQSHLEQDSSCPIIKETYLKKKIHHLTRHKIRHKESSVQYNCYTYMHTKFSCMPEEIHSIIAANFFRNKSLQRSKGSCGQVLKKRWHWQEPRYTLLLAHLR